MFFEEEQEGSLCLSPHTYILSINFTNSNLAIPFYSPQLNQGALAKDGHYPISYNFDPSGGNGRHPFTQYVLPPPSLASGKSCPY